MDKEILIIIIILISILFMMGFVTFIAYLSFRKNKDEIPDENLGNVKWIRFKNMGDPIPSKIEGNRIISEQLGYQFTLPEGFEIVSQNKYYKENIYTEFLAFDGKKSVTVIIYIMDGSDIEKGKEEFHQKAILREIIRLSYKDFDPEKLEFCDFCGLPCAHYAGLGEDKSKDGQNYIERYTYVDPYRKIDFVVTCGEDLADQTKEIFDHFKVLEK